MAKVEKKTLVDLFNELNITDVQKDFINKYSRIRTATRFEQEAMKIIGSPELVKDWYYGGYVDTGYFGGGKCTRGHTLRYEHHAVNKVTNENVIFGVKCVEDFFQITPQQLKLIKQGVVETNNELIESLETLQLHKTFAAYTKATNLLNRYNALITKPKNAIQIDEFIALELPLPRHLFNEVIRQYNVEASKREFKAFLAENPVYLDIVTKAQDIEADNAFKNRHSDVWNKVTDIVGFLRKNRRLSDPQVKLLTKLTSVDYEKVDAIIDDLNLLPQNKFTKFNGFDEYGMITSIIDSYNKWGISEKQLAALEKSHNKHLKAIEEIKNGELDQVC